MMNARLLNRLITPSYRTYSTHIQLSKFQKVLLAAGSGLTAIIDPYRGDMVADFGETTGEQALNWMRSKMLQSSEGQEVLIQKPRLNTSHVDYDALADLPKTSFGHQYWRFYSDNQISPDTRRVVQFVDDPELAYVMQRYRELHDIIHTLLGMSIDVPSEIVVKAFEAMQTRLPMCFLASLVGPLKMTHAERLDYIRRDLWWAIRCGRESKFLMSVYFEQRFEQDIDDLRRELNINLGHKSNIT